MWELVRSWKSRQVERFTTLLGGRMFVNLMIEGGSFPGRS